MTKPRPETPQDIKHRLTTLGFDVPEIGQVINIHALDRALKESGARLEDRLRFKSTLREARLIAP